jgi:hypothetical protein
MTAAQRNAFARLRDNMPMNSNMKRCLLDIGAAVKLRDGRLAPKLAVLDAFNDAYGGRKS